MTKNQVPRERKGEISRKELSEMEASNISNIEFIIMVISRLEELDENYRNMKKNIETMKENQ